MADGDDDQDVYVTQLKEVFDTCDTSSTGYLNEEDLTKLCNKLQLDDQTDALVKLLLNGDPEARVGFEEFKEGFVAVLSETVDGMEDSSEEEDETEEDRLSPKYVKGGKLYGRRSRPTTDTEGDAGDEHSDSDSFASPRQFMADNKLSRSLPNPKIQSLEEKESDSEDDKRVRKSEGDGETKTVSSKGEGTGEGDKDGEEKDTFEAEGQMNLAIGDMENALDPVSEEEHLKEIWKDLGVGTSGYLSKTELANVCEHIGMEEMNNEELQHLFDKLDVDGDGRVSFDEFLRGLFQHGGPHTPLSTPARPLSTPRQRLRLSVAPDESRTTPSFASIGPGFFSNLDVDDSGYATPDAIVELWESLGVTQGHDILEYLQYDVGTSRISLADLSYALDQELRSVEEDNATYQAAVASYQHELRYLRTSVEQVCAERDKFKNDLSEANNRITLLVKDADERHTALEKTKEKEMITVEKKYQEQIKTLQADVDNEREIITQQSNKQRQRLEKELDKLKDEDKNLREKMALTQKDLEKLEKELLDMTEKFRDSERINVRQQRELEAAADIHRKLEENESHRALILDEHQKYSEQRHQQLELDKKELKDQNDELTAEVEDLRQQMAQVRRGKKSTRSKDKEGPNRTGSILSDYAKPSMVSKHSDELSDNSEDESSTSTTASGRARRRLPHTPDEHDPEREQLKKQVEEISQDRDSHRDRLEELQRNYSIDKKDIEDAFKMEIADLEDQHIREKNDLIKKLRREIQAELDEEFDEKLQKEMQNEEERMRNEIEQIKRDMDTKFRHEKDLLEENYAEEKASIINRMREEFEEEMTNRLQQERESYEKELEKTVTVDTSDYVKLKQEKADLELKLKLQEEELNMKHQKERQALQEMYDKEKAAIEDRHRMDILDYENMFAKGKDALKGRLRTDFYDLLDQQTLGLSKEEREKAMRAVKKEQDELQLEHEEEKHKLVQNLNKERQDLEKKYRDKITDLEQALDIEKKQMEIEREQFKSTLKRERDEIGKEKEILREAMEEELSNEIQSRLEEEFLLQMDRLKAAFEDERSELEHRIQLLQDELDDLTHAREMEEKFRQQMEAKNVGEGDNFKREVERLNRMNEELAHEKSRAEEKIHQLIIEKTEAISASTTQSLMAAPPSGNEQELHRVVEEKKDLEKSLISLQEKFASQQDTFMEAERIKAKNERWEEEREALQQQIEITSDKLAEANTKLAIARSEYLRELQIVREKASSLIEVSKYNDLNARLVEAERKTKEMEVALEQRSSETSKLLINSQGDYQRTIHDLQTEKDEKERLFNKTKSILDEQVAKLKKMYEKSTKTDILVKDLYVENAHLMKCLEQTEKKEKDAERRVYKLEDKCKALTKVIYKIAPVALS